MKGKYSKALYVWSLVVKGLVFAFAIPAFLFLLFIVYRFGYSIGFNEGGANAEEYYLSFIEEMRLAVVQQEPLSSTQDTDELSPVPMPTKKVSFIREADWGGPQLWEAVNKRRSGLGVNPLSSADELCTIASIRLNELLELGKLDGHVGFSNMPERRADLKWIFDKYSNVAEFLAMGGSTADETVSLWENTLGHKKLLSGGEYVWGCVYAQNTFAVAITAF